MPIHRTYLITLAFAVMLSTPAATQAQAPQTDRIEITGDYRYAKLDSEDLADAKSLACREAWRLAVVNSPLYREQTESIIDSPLLRNLAYRLAENHVQARQIVEQTGQRRTVSCRVRGFLPADESLRVIRTQLAGEVPVPEAIDQNRTLRILRVREEEGGMLAIQYQALKRLDWLDTHYQGGLRESADIMVDFYGEQGFLIHNERHPARRTPTGDDIMNPGAVAVLKVTKPVTAKTYRVWLVK